MISKALVAAKRIRACLVGHPVVFHHVPKCAGTSVSRALRFRYALSQQSIASIATVDVLKLRAGHKSWSQERHAAEVRQLRLDLLHYFMWQGHAFIGGHVPFSRAAYQQYCGRYRFITVLREPEQRFVSHYFFNLNRDHHAKITLPLDEYLETEDARRAASVYSEYFSSNSSPDEAIRNLALFDLIGFVDQLDDFRMALKHTLGVTIPASRQRAATVPTSERMAEFSPSVRARITELCATDRRIYEAARALHSESSHVRLQLRGITP